MKQKSMAMMLSSIEIPCMGDYTFQKLGSAPTFIRAEDGDLRVFYEVIIEL